MTNHTSRRGFADVLAQRFWSRRPLPAIAGLALLIPVVMVFTGAADISGEPIELSLKTIEPTVFQKHLEQHGVVEPMRSSVVESECYWTTRILSIVPEGTWVQKGDVVCTLDSSDIEEYARGREIILIKYRSRLDNALHDQQMLKPQNERRLAAAQHQYNIAEGNLQKYLEGTFPQDLDEIQKNLSILSDQMSTAQSEMQHAEHLWALGLVSRRELEQQSFDYLKAQQNFDRMEASHNFLIEFTHPRTRIKLTHQLNDSHRDLLRTEISNSLAETKAKLSTLTYERVVRVYERYYKRALESIEACTMRAPCDGQVIYSNSWKLKSLGISQVEEGARVRLRQKIFEIPDSNRLKVSVPIHESMVYKISEGMPVDVQLSGYEDEVIEGKITSIAKYPRLRSSYTPGVKDYWIDVELLPTDEQSQIVRTRMDAVVRMTLVDNSEAITVPKDSIVGIAGKNFVWVYDGKELVPREIDLGETNEELACVTSGLQPGEQIAVSMTSQHRESLEETLTEHLDR